MASWHLPTLPPIVSHCHCNFLWYIRLTSTRDLSRQTRDFYPKNLLGLQLWSLFGKCERVTLGHFRSKDLQSPMSSIAKRDEIS